MLRAMEATDTFMPIGRFARLTGLSVKALRHYDELGLLRPATVDADTGYRSYSTDQVERAETIRLLRRLELPLDDIATILATDDPTELRSVLLDHQRRTASRSAELKSQQDVDADGEGRAHARGRRRDAPLHARIRVPLAARRHDGEPRAERVAVLTRERDPRTA